MAQCRTCKQAFPEESRFCPSCGAPAAGPVLVTATIAARSLSEPSLSSSVDEGRFIPGTLLADRYRVIGPLGKGGMGEVYRATDIRLGQTVALKFLPDEASTDAARLARFHNEVRIARQVTHPNVCRVYDIGEFEGLPFLSMEFVDGEDLASLLRRIGRLPPDKATEIARKLCAGLAAAHAQGVLHRDLKPANIMIDGRGQVVITDFGLAGMAAELQNADIRSGTPAYMAPEQLTGKEVSVQSDLYALGPVLYEVFTGKKAFEANSLAEMIRLRESGPPASVSSVVRDIDPGIEHVIVRCLDPDPRKRPPSALAIAAALPGGDPLAAALAAGETPSPEMVAAAGASEGLRPLVAGACLFTFVAGLIAFIFFFSQQVYIGKVKLELPPDALAVEAHRILQKLGYTAPPADRAWGLSYASQWLQYLDRHKPSGLDWTAIANGRPAPLLFWYRESPRPLATQQFHGPGIVAMSDPPLQVSGMTAVQLDPEGRLIYFEAVPPQFDTRPPLQSPLDSQALFTAAGLDSARFTPAEPQWNPSQIADARAAWTGTFPGRSENIRVEAASWRGKPVYFNIVGPWTSPTRMQASRLSTQQRANQILWSSLFVVLLIAGSLLSWRNLYLGRGDRQGAFRIASAAFVLGVSVWLFGGHHVPWPAETDLFMAAAAGALLSGGQLWISYVALEPFVRRHWPRTIITWTRLLGGGWRDPLVGRDVLIGMVVGGGYDLVLAAAGAIKLSHGDTPSSAPRFYATAGFPAFGSEFLRYVLDSLTGGMVFLLLFFLLRVLLRKEWLAAIAFVALFAGVKGLSSDYPVVDTAMFLIIYSIAVFLLLHYGFLALLVCTFVTDTMLGLVFTPDFGAWYGISSLFTTLLLVGLALFAFRTSTAGKPLFEGFLDR